MESGLDSIQLSFDSSRVFSIVGTSIKVFSNMGCGRGPTVPKRLLHNEDLSFQALLHKVTMLMALANADRCSDLALLDLDYMQYEVNGVKFVILGLTKTRRSGSSLEAFNPAFPDGPQLCPVKALRCYQAQPAELRLPQEAERERQAHYL